MLYKVCLFVSVLKISTMREEEKSLRQKLSDVEKVKKQLQADVANRDRTIQQLRAVRSEAASSSCLCAGWFIFVSSPSPASFLQEQSSETKSDQTLYQKACKGKPCVSLCVCCVEARAAFSS